MTAVKGFEVLTGTYLGQDWELFGATVDEAIVNFVRGQDPNDVDASITGLEELLATPMKEQEYYDRWIYGLHSGYDPRDDGHTFREWFAHALEVLRTAATAADG